MDSAYARHRWAVPHRSGIHDVLPANELVERIVLIAQDAGDAVAPQVIVNLDKPVAIVPLVLEVLAADFLGLAGEVPLRIVVVRPKTVVEQPIVITGDVRRVAGD